MMRRCDSKQMPFISVCIANYNGIGVIDECLRSVQAQEGDAALEIIVHDDASSDGSAEYIRAHYPHVVLLESLENVGFCVSNNRMAARARGQFMLLLNNDAVLFPDALATLRAAAQRIGKPAILSLAQYDYETGKLIDIGSLCDPFLNPVPNGHGEATPDDETRHASFPLPNPPQEGEGANVSLREFHVNLDAVRCDVATVSGACLWIPRSLWEELGGFPEWFHTLAEDTYLCFRARVAGYPVMALGSSGFRHWVGKSLGGGRVTAQNRLATSRRRRALSERNKSFVMALTYPAPLLQMIFPLHIALLLIEGLILALLKREWRLFREIYLACIQGLWLERQRLFRLRREIQSGKKIRLKSFLAVFKWMPHKLSLLLRHGLPHIR